MAELSARHAEEAAQIVVAEERSPEHERMREARLFDDSQFTVSVTERNVHEQAEDLIFLTNSMREDYGAGANVKMWVEFWAEEITPSGVFGSKRNKKVSFRAENVLRAHVQKYINHFWWAMVEKCRQKNYLLVKYELIELSPVGPRVRNAP